jgi:hypothetical protein
MLRWLVVLLLAANLGFYAWTRGWLDPVAGPAAQGEREPERVGRQLHPEAVQLLSPRAASIAEAAASAGAVACLEAGPFADPELAAAEDALRQAGIADSLWQSASVDRPGVWLVYMGRFADREALQRKSGELKRLRVEAEELHDAPEHEPGLSLGRFNDRAAADAALAQATQHGVHSAKVLALTPPAQLHALRVERPAPRLVKQLQSLQAPALGNGFRACGA